MRCDICGLTYNPKRRWEDCPHPAHNDPGDVIKIERFASKNKAQFPLVLGLDYGDPHRVLGFVKLNGNGREFFNTKTPLPLRLSMGAFQIGEVMVPVEFAITHPPIDPVFGDVKR